jgi:hypothetical protein
LDADGRARVAAFDDDDDDDPRLPGIFNDWTWRPIFPVIPILPFTAIIDDDSGGGGSDSGGCLSEFASTVSLWRIEQYWNSDKAVTNSPIYKFLNRTGSVLPLSFAISKFQFSAADSHYDPSDPAYVMASSIYRNPRLDDTFLLYRRLAKEGRYDEAHGLVSSDAALLSSLLEEPFFTIELGALQILRGEHSEAYKYCKRGLSSLPGSKLAHTCVGVAGTYLGIEQGTVESLYTALRLQVVADQNLRSQTAAYSDVASPRAAEEPPSAGLKSMTIFNTSVDTLAYNVISALKTFKRYQECVDILVTFADVGELNNEEIFLITIFSMVDWAKEKEDLFNKYEAIVRSRGVFKTKTEMSLFELTNTFRFRTKHLVNSALECVERSVSATFAREATTDLTNLVLIEEPYSPPGILGSIEDLKTLDEASMEYYNSIEKVVLVTQLFISEVEEINEDMLKALSKNLANPYISEVVILSENYIEFSGLEYPNRLIQRILPKRLTFQDAFHFANELYPDRLVAVANADIHFDSSFSRLCRMRHERVNMTNRVFALGTWMEEDEEDSKEPSSSSLSSSSSSSSSSSLVTAMFMLRTDSQDAWIFRTPMSAEVLHLANFELGKVRADGVLAHVLLHTNYSVINPMFALHAFEADSKQRTNALYDTKDFVPGLLEDVLVSDKMRFF